MIRSFFYYGTCTHLEVAATVATFTHSQTTIVTKIIH